MRRVAGVAMDSPQVREWSANSTRQRSVNPAAADAGRKAIPRPWRTRPAADA